MEHSERKGIFWLYPKLSAFRIPCPAGRVSLVYAEEAGPGGEESVSPKP